MWVCNTTWSCVQFCKLINWKRKQYKLFESNFSISMAFSLASLFLRNAKWFYALTCVVKYGRMWALDLHHIVCILTLKVILKHLMSAFLSLSFWRTCSMGLCVWPTRYQIQSAKWPEGESHIIWHKWINRQNTTLVF